MSSMLEEKFDSEKSPPLSPRPVKSKRSTGMPRAASAWLMNAAAFELFEHVKQCAKSAYARGSPAGISRRAASAWPCAEGNSSLIEVMYGLLLPDAHLR